MPRNCLCRDIISWKNSDSKNRAYYSDRINIPDYCEDDINRARAHDASQNQFPNISQIDIINDNVPRYDEPNSEAFGNAAIFCVLRRFRY